MSRKKRGRRPVVVKALAVSRFARLVNVDTKAVQKAIASGRLPASVLTYTATGAAKIADVDGARAAWHRNAGRPGPDRGLTLVAVQQTVAEQRARSLRLSNDVKEGRLIPADKAIREAFEAARVIREALLNLPARLCAELAAEANPQRVYLRLDAELRGILESCAQTLAG